MRALLILGAALAFSQTANAKVLVIDQLRVLAESKAGKDATGKLSDLAKKRSGEFRPAAEALEAEKNSLEAQIRGLRPGQDNLSDELRQRLASFRERSTEFESQRQRIERELEQTRQKSYETLFEELQPILKDIAKKKKADIVLEKRATLYANEAIDVTNEIIKSLDKKLQTIKVEWVSLNQPQNAQRPPESGTPPTAAPSLGVK